MKDAPLIIEISFRQVDDVERGSRLDQFYNLLLEGAIASAKRGCQDQDNAIIHDDVTNKCKQ